MGTKVRVAPIAMVQLLTHHVAALLHRPVLLLRLFRTDQIQHLRHHAPNLRFTPSIRLDSMGSHRHDRHHRHHLHPRHCERLPSDYNTLGRNDTRLLQYQA